MAKRAPPSSFPWGLALLGTAVGSGIALLLWPRTARGSLLPGEQPPLRPEPTPSAIHGAPPVPTPTTPPSATHPAHASTPRSSLRPIASATTQAVQSALRDAGYGASLGSHGVDGAWGGATDAALTAWASSSGTTLGAALGLAQSNPAALIAAINATVPTVVGSLSPVQVRMAIQSKLNAIAGTTHLLDELRSPQNQALLGGRRDTNLDGAKNTWTVMALNALGLRGWETQWDHDPAALFATVNAIS